MTDAAKTHHEWPGNRAINDESLKLHDELCDILEEHGHSETEIVTISVGIWGGLQAMKEQMQPALQESQAKVKELESKLAVAVKCLENVKILIGSMALTMFPINVRELDGSISQHRPKSNAGMAYDSIKEALEKIKPNEEK